MKRWKLYFRFEHLPPHLRVISEPFARMAALIDEGVGVTDPRVASAQVACLHPVPDRNGDPDEIGFAQACFFAAMASFNNRALALRSLLLAKDATVRAHIPDPAEPA